MTQPDKARAARIDAILAHPRFAEARRAQIEGYLGLYSGDPALNKLLVEGARHVMFTFILCLAAAQREDDPETWLTLGKLQDVVSTYQVGSPGLLEALVTRMTDRGLLTSTTAPGDRRKRILAPTEALLMHDRDLLAVQAAPCAIIANTPGLTLAMARDPAFQQIQRTASMAAFADAMVLLGANPQMMAIFVARDSGLLALFMLMSSALASPGGDLSTVPYQQIADRFGVSRTHVRELIADAEKAGLMRVTSAASGNVVEMLPPLWPLADRWIAGCMELFADCCDRAYAMKSAAPAS